MRACRSVLAAAALLAGAVVPAFAQYYPGAAPGYWYGPGVGLYYGAPYTWGPPGFYGPGYGYGYGYAVPGYAYGTPPPMVYIERNQPVAPAQPAAPAAPAAQQGATTANDWWYLCASPRGAYPYVRECPGGWERVPAVPPGQLR